ncbi:hypothetical protein CIL05_00880 [Virgibacillus profundi]|uniref:Major facilitator superfamily (MFS) profile domain-containing protein n=1 Tax=Virgibacillus profundi TaxID=2024555 RepID=A0A2A2IGW1_9BACI|nr:MFS transporter [Virgibacillus profundi]PAV31241.1 hypothetical protein CIL05_00880 [Virgibacillus profundi]PXY55426.1 MFS transporter [Virgibacillus profundi]
MKYSLLKVYYFIFAFGTGAFQFLNLYYVDVGLTTAQIGILFAVGPFVMIFAQPFWGMLTDYWGSPKITLFIMIIGSLATALFFPFSFEFEQLLYLNIIYFFFQSSIPPIADATALSLLDDRNDFGKIRLWGSFGYAVGVMSVGKILDLFGLQLMFILHSCFLLIALLLALRLPIKKGGKKDFSIQKAVSLFKNPAFIMFLLFSFLVHLTVHANNSFYAIYIQNMGATLTIVGFALLIKSIFEIPFFAISSKLMSRFSFPFLLSTAAIIYAFRWLILGYSDGLQILVWSQILLSLSYAIQYFVSVAYVDVIAPERYRATGQTFYWAVTFGLGGLVGNILAGFLLDYVEIDEMYRLAGLLSLASVILLWIKPKRRIQ